MERTDLINYGYLPQLCKVGELFFKEPFFCILGSDGEVDLRSTNNDLVSLGTATTLDGIRNIEKEWWKQRLKNRVGDVMAISFFLDTEYHESVPDSVRAVIKEYFGDV